MRACSGTWIAHGSGSADREVVDKHDRVAVPPEKPAYQIRRVWLTPEEEAGYYYGFANEGLWPLCHIAHVRPTFRSERLGPVRRGQPQVRQGRGQARPRPRTPSCWCRTTTSRCCRRMIRERTARCDDHHLLAHPLAQSGVVRHLPVARRSARRACSAAASSAFTRSSTATTSSIRWIAFSRRASTANPSPSPSAASSPPCAAIRFPSPGRRNRKWCRKPVADCRSSIRAAERPAARTQARRRRRPPRLHQGHHRALPRHRAPAGTESGVDRPLHLRPDRRADALGHRGIPASRGAGAGHGRAHQRPLRRARDRRPSCSRSSTTNRARSTSISAPPISASSAACTTA